MEKLQRARGAVRPNATTYPLFTKSNEELTITVGNWNLSCKKDGELSIINSDGQQQVKKPPELQVLFNFMIFCMCIHIFQIINIILFTILTKFLLIVFFF